VLLALRSRQRYSLKTRGHGKTLKNGPASVPPPISTIARRNGGSQSRAVTSTIHDRHTQQLLARCVERAKTHHPAHAKRSLRYVLCDDWPALLFYAICWLSRPDNECSFLCSFRYNPVAGPGENRVGTMVIQALQQEVPCIVYIDAPDSLELPVARVAVSGGCILLIYSRRADKEVEAAIRDLRGAR
jgi:hypothetical protein